MNGGSVPSLLTCRGRPGAQGAESELLPAEDSFPQANHLRTDATSCLLPRRLDPAQPREPGARHARWAQFTPCVPIYPLTVSPLPSKQMVMMAAPQQRVCWALGVTHRTKDPSPSLPPSMAAATTLLCAQTTRHAAARWQDMVGMRDSRAAQQRAWLPRGAPGRTAHRVPSAPPLPPTAAFISGAVATSPISNPHVMHER